MHTKIRRSKISGKIRAAVVVSAGLTAAIACQQSVSASPAHSENAPSPAESSEQAYTTDAECTTDSTTYEPVELMEDPSEWADLTREGVNNGSIPLVNIGETDLQWDGVKAIPNPDDGRTAVVVPAHKYATDSSGLILEYSASQELLQTRENHFERIGSHEIEFTNSVDGATVTTEKIQEPEVSIQGFSWSTFKKCASSLGVPNWAVGIVVAACFAGPAIAACIAGSAVFGASRLAQCADRAQGLPMALSNESNMVA
ncbi:hypothetical protein [Haloglycomyces albus]|uniref:hypothetical protein n=1 Tax=Haloglycomyces albus TaxID=526067 RepID=UPI00046D9475|nr:hypothetical protein [Haloglycomyces albus]